VVDVEIERKYLLKYIPEGLEDCEHKEILDIYIPKEHPHSAIRLRKNGNSYEITKKTVKSEDRTIRHEETIILTKEEFDTLSKIDGKISHKIRYHYFHNGKMFEIDIFLGALRGLIMVDVEFKNIKSKDDILMPEFCIADITSEMWSAGGLLCGKSYSDIEKNLDKYNYKKLFMKNVDFTGAVDFVEKTNY
jgi:adenylate cyclase